MKALATNLCNNILLRGKRDHVAITPMKLQKLMYYVCRDYVHQTGDMPIGEKFEVWKYGPVLPSVYAEFKPFGAYPITAFARDATGRPKTVSESKNPILAQVLDITWAKYKRLSAVELSAMTHKEGSGWYRAYMDDRDRISLEDMANDRT